MDVRLITNVGYWAGGNGKGAIYDGVTPGGTHLFAIKMLAAGAEVWKYLRLSEVQTGLGMGDIKVAGNLNMALFTDAKNPEFVTAIENDYPTITNVTNGAGLPRVIELQEPYTLKGEGVTSADIDKLKTSSGGGLGAGATDDTKTPTTTDKGILGGIIPQNFDGLFKNPFQFIQDNPLFIALVVGLVYFFRRKKKKPLWLF